MRAGRVVRCRGHSRWRASRSRPILVLLRRQGPPGHRGYGQEFNASQSKYRHRRLLQGDYFQALPRSGRHHHQDGTAIFHVIGEAMPDLCRAGCCRAWNRTSRPPVSSRDSWRWLVAARLLRLLREVRAHLRIPSPQHAGHVLQQGMLDARRQGSTTWTSCGRGHQAQRPRGSDREVWGYRGASTGGSGMACLYQAGGTLLSADGKQAGFRQKGGRPCNSGGSRQQDKI